MIRYSEQYIDEFDIEGIKETLESDYLTQGPRIEQFEKALQNFTDAQFAVGVCNATAALHLTYLAAGMSKKSLVWTVANTFVATASSAVYCGAEVDFVDIELENYSLSLESFETKLNESDRNPDFLIVVHFAGRALDLSNISCLCAKHGITIIEDASHALGAKVNSQMVGACCYSIATIFSFHPVKTITTAEGGCVTSNNNILVSKIKKLRSHSIENQTTVPWYKTQTEIGFNYRMNELQASLGLTQLKKIHSLQLIRRSKANTYLSELKNANLINPKKDNQKSISSWHLFVVRLDGVDENYRNFIMNKLLAKNIGVNFHYYPLYKLKSFRRTDLLFPKNEVYFKTAITLPLSPKMTEVQQEFIIETITKSLKK
jgi:dTDP-4-amino-4,6-dideoxygalactose transaminase